jgi:polyisoprenoid-binding protein YceI
VITPDQSTVEFFVKSSVALEGNFDKWDATLTFKSTDFSTGVLDIKIQAATVNTGSGMKDRKLKSKDFFNVKDDPLFTFVSCQRSLCRPAPTPPRCKATLRYAE